MSQKKLLFLTLNTFSSTGGIEKVCRVAGKALAELAAEAGSRLMLFAMNDKPEHLLKNYIAPDLYFPFSGKKARFAFQAIKTGRTCDIVILSHVNLLSIGFLINLLSPKTKVVLIAHGIEVWKEFPFWKLRMLKAIDLILPVSHYTKQKMQSLYNLDSTKMQVVNNCLDPYLTKNDNAILTDELRSKLGLGKNEAILFTLTRLKSSEQYKGYDKVIMALPSILKKYPNVKYLIAGKYDQEEKERLDQLIVKLELSDKVIFAGFIKDDEIETYFSLADIYIMPSAGEGFGIVFIEALFYDKPVIAGNVDGSVDALNKGEFGLLVNPAKIEEITHAVETVFNNKTAFLPDEKAVEERFSFKTYKTNLSNVLKLNKMAISKENSFISSTKNLNGF
jgi:phosphatidyl-myo-inositol dimannoside synthase